MPLHQAIQRLLLLGTRLELPPPRPTPQPPQRLLPLIEAIAPAHQAFDERAVFSGHRYRSGFWAIYLLSAIAVLCAVLPLALGWDSRNHALHPFAGLWAVAEVCTIAIVSAIYWRGHRRDWQGEWLRTRTTAELTWYLPLVAPLVDFPVGSAEGNWYQRVFDPGQHLSGTDDVAMLCARNEALARQLLEACWSDPAFISSYARWSIDILREQRHYHHRVAAKQHALLHRVHRVNGWLFGLTALGAMLHLWVHTLWLTLVTTFFPALGASLHGALAQTESYRLAAASERLVVDLQGAIERIQGALDALAPDAANTALVSDASASAEPIKASIEAAIALILQEHQDWQMLVRPHHLPLG
jgi:hypothetical protein